MSSMGEWWHDLWNDPMNENPWALGALVLILVAMFAAFELTYRLKQSRRRKQETSMNAADPTPIRPESLADWTQSADDRQAADRAAAERLIAESRADGADRAGAPTRASRPRPYRRA
jgi:hypothetical protein